MAGGLLCVVVGSSLGTQSICFLTAVSLLLISSPSLGVHVFILIVQHAVQGTLRNVA
jgi:hypothetical protein